MPPPDLLYCLAYILDTTYGTSYIDDTSQWVLNDVARNIHFDVTMGHDFAMGTLSLSNA